MTNNPLIEIKPHELSLLAEARNLLRELEGRVTASVEGIRVRRPTVIGDFDLLHMGRIQESAYSAADAVSDFLITLDSFGNMNLSNDILHGPQKSDA